MPIVGRLLMLLFLYQIYAVNHLTVIEVQNTFVSSPNQTTQLTGIIVVESTKIITLKRSESNEEGVCVFQFFSIFLSF